MKSLNKRIEDLKDTRRVLCATFAVFAAQLSIFDETTPAALCLIVAVMGGLYIRHRPHRFAHR